MDFRNLTVYRLPAPWAVNVAELETQLAKFRFTPPTSAELLRAGWESPRGNGQLVHEVQGQLMIMLQVEKKLLPASVINAVAKARAAELADQQGFAPGKKAMRELKEKVADELLPRAFSIPRATRVWIDPKHGWLVVDTASSLVADDVVKHLLKAVDKLPLSSLRVQRSPVAQMTGWLEFDEAPVNFTVDQDADLSATGESKAKVKYVRHTLEPEDVQRHIKSGKQCTRLALTWNDKISFVLTDGLAIRSVRSLDVLKESDQFTRDDVERFDNAMFLMAGEFAGLLRDLVDAMGGEAEA
jgi:recombination associated protein RdgC